jgi:hypothetical protein
MAQPLDKISVFNTGPSKNDLAIERLQKDMAGLRGQMGLVSLQHSAIKQDQAKISKDFDAFEVRMNAEKKMQDEYDRDIRERLRKVEVVLWPRKMREDGWDVEDQEPLLDRVMRLQEHDEKITGQITKIEDLLWPHMRHMDRPEDVRRHSLVTRIEWIEHALNDAKIYTVPVMLAHYTDAIRGLETQMQDVTRDLDILRTRVFQTKDVSTHVLYAPLPITLS